jgi:N,N'-diacetyllegionaminate synthase
MSKVFIIAEAGVNHNGDIKIATRMIDEAVKFGADAIKFQTFHAVQLVTKMAKKAEYQQVTTKNDESQYEMLRRLELSEAQFGELLDCCKKRNIQFMSTPFDFDSIDLLQRLDVPIWKIPSGEITNLPYLLKLARTCKPIILSTGMSTLDEVGKAINVLRKNGSGEVTALHCNTEYPTPYNDVNLNAMRTMQRELGVEVGYSDHTPGIEVSIAAVALGAVVIEKHFTLDKNMEGPDHKASLEPVEFAAMIRAIRNIEKSLGGDIKGPTPSEIKNISIVRKSIVAKYPIKKGDVFTEGNITTKRPASGISPMKWFEVIGTGAIKDFVEDEMIVL